MQTKYFETSGFIRHEDNIVNLSAYRQKLSAVSGEGFAPLPESKETQRETEPAALTLVETAVRPRRSVRRRSPLLSLCLDVGVSISVLLFTMTALIQFLHIV